MVRCSQCEAPAPDMSTIETTWARYGWRVARNVTPAGQYSVDFFCPDCWKTKKAQATADSPPSS